MPANSDVSAPYFSFTAAFSYHMPIVVIVLLLLGIAAFAALWFFRKPVKAFFDRIRNTPFKTWLRTSAADTDFLSEDSDSTAEDDKTEQGLALYRKGKKSGDGSVLRQAIELLQQQLAALPQQRQPVAWAKTQNDLGNALRTLGELELHAEFLKAAINSYAAALQVFTRERYPSKWSKLHTNLGNAFHDLAGVENGTGYLREAVKAYRLALEEHPRWREPPTWAKIQSSLGNALAVMGRREANAAYLQEAAEAYRQALDVYENTHTAAARRQEETTLHILEQIEESLEQLTADYPQSLGST
ncbi:MAG: hypothetical protein ACU837_14125 [Gammaproteobacteria bacterium]